MNIRTSRTTAIALATIALAATSLTPALAQEATTAQRRALSRAIDRSTAVLVDPAVIQRSPEVVSGAATHVAPTVAAPAPQDPAAAIHADAGVLAKRLNRGELAHVQLDTATEAAASDVLHAQVAQTAPGQAATLQSFEGAVMQLAEDDTEIRLKPYVLVGQRLQYAPDTGQFVGTVLVGATDLVGDATSRALTAPLIFEVLESAQADPSRVELKHTSPPYERIRVASNVRDQPLEITIASNFSPDGVRLKVPVEPALMVNIDGGDLRAWGMQAARVTVSAVGLKPAAGTPVQIEAPGAFLTDPDPPAFDAMGVAHATLRTDAAGLVTVTASASQYAPGARGVNVIVPWFTLLVVTIGGLVGGLLHMVGKPGRRPSMQRIGFSLLVSALLGLVVFGLYVVGVRSLPVDFKVQVGDTFAFVVAALAGWAGVSLVRRRLVAED